MTYRTGLILVAMAGMIWSLQAVALRGIESPSTWAILFWRGFGTVLAGLVALRLNGSGPVLLRLRRAGLSGGLAGGGLVLAFAGAIWAIQTTTIANAVFLFSASPFLAAGLALLVLGERVRPATWAAIGLALGGMYLTVEGGLSGGSLSGNLAAITSAFGFALFTVALRAGRSAEMMPAVVLGGVFAMATGAAVLMAQGAPLILSARDIGLAVLIGGGIVGLGLALYTEGSRSLSATELTLLSQIEVILAPFWALVLLGEQASAATWLGGAIVIAAVVLNGLSGAGRAPWRR